MEVKKVLRRMKGVREVFPGLSPWLDVLPHLISAVESALKTGDYYMVAPLCKIISSLYYEIRREYITQGREHPRVENFLDALEKFEESVWKAIEGWETSPFNAPSYIPPHEEEPYEEKDEED